MNHNLVQIGGNLTRDVEIKTLPGGSIIGDVSIAVNRVWKNQSGEKQEEVTFVNCTAFGKTAENIAKYFHKGDQIFISGRLKQETWDDKTTGKKMSRLKVVIESFEFIGGKKTQASVAPDASDKPQRSADDVALDASPDEIPF